MRLSDPLKHDAIAAGYIQPWARDNAKRKPDRKGYRLRSSGPLARAPRESGQLLLFPEFSKPVARLQAFRGGRMPPAVAAEAEFRRTRTSRLHSGNQSVSDEAPTAFRNFGAFKTQQQADPSLEIPVDAACM